MIFLASIFGLCSELQAKEPSPHFLYFVLVDRFYNGDQSNDQTIALNDPQAFHGGDLNGIEAKLDYLEDLGVDSLWLSPVFSMRAEKFHGHGAFHGYWVQNLDSIEARFGGEEALLSLSQATKENDMSLILDMVYNHVSFDSPMVTAHPDWFHSYPSITDWNDPFQLTNYQVHGLPDLDQSQPPVYKYLLEQSLHWQQKAGVQGFRIDAIRHLENDFLARISKDSSAWMLGEDFDGNPAALIKRAEETGLDALFDFPLYYALTQDLCDQDQVSQIASIISMDQYYPEDLKLVRFLDNHDLPRIYSRCKEDKVKVYQALTLLFSIQGIPMLSYGTESWTTGNSEPENRASFDWDSIDQNLRSTIKTLAMFRKEHPVLEKGTAQIVHYTAKQLVIEQFWNGFLSYTVLNLSEQNIPFTPPSNASFISGLEQRDGNISSKKEFLFPPKTTSILIYQGTRTPSPNQTMTITVNTSQKGEFLLVGSSPDFGSWNVKKGIPLHKQKTGYISTISLPQNQIISFKIVEKKEDQYHWEQGENHFLWTMPNNSDNLIININKEK